MYIVSQFFFVCECLEKFLKIVTMENFFLNLWQVQKHGNNLDVLKGHLKKFIMTINFNSKKYLN